MPSTTMPSTTIRMFSYSTDFHKHLGENLTWRGYTMHSRAATAPCILEFFFSPHHFCESRRAHIHAHTSQNTIVVVIAMAHPTSVVLRVERVKHFPCFSRFSRAPTFPLRTIGTLMLLKLTTSSILRHCTSWAVQLFFGSALHIDIGQQVWEMNVVPHFPLRQTATKSSIRTAAACTSRHMLHRYIMDTAAAFQLHHPEYRREWVYANACVSALVYVCIVNIPISTCVSVYVFCTDKYR